MEETAATATIAAAEQPPVPASSPLRQTDQHAHHDDDNNNSCKETDFEKQQHSKNPNYYSSLKDETVVEDEQDRPTVNGEDSNNRFPHSVPSTEAATYNWKNGTTDKCHNEKTLLKHINEKEIKCEDESGNQDFPSKGKTDDISKRHHCDDAQPLCLATDSDECSRRSPPVSSMNEIDQNIKEKSCAADLPSLASVTNDCDNQEIINEHDGKTDINLDKSAGETGDFRETEKVVNHNSCEVPQRECFVSNYPINSELTNNGGIFPFKKYKSLNKYDRYDLFNFSKIH